MVAVVAVVVAVVPVVVAVVAVPAVVVAVAVGAAVVLALLELAGQQSDVYIRDIFQVTFFVHDQFGQSLDKLREFWANRML